MNSKIKQNGRKAISIDSLKVTPPRTANEINNRIRQSRFTELKNNQASTYKI